MNRPAKHRRRKPPATATTANLASALRAKLGAATLKLLDVQKAEQPPSSGRESHHDLVLQLVRSARSVYSVAETFGKAWLPGNSFEAWRDKWEDGLTDSARVLWHYIQDLRDADEHGDGAGLIPTDIPVVLDDCMPTNAALLGLGPGHQPTASKVGVRFSPYPDKPASEVCADYLELCRRFVDKFLLDHPQ